MNSQLLKDYKKLESKNDFLNFVNGYTGKAINTLRGIWFKDAGGNKIPEEYHAIVREILDRSLAYEKQKREQKILFYEKNIIKNEAIK